jgi:chromate transporter
LVISCLNLLYTFFKIGLLGFGGGYAMMSMIMAEGAKLSITTAQLADLNALDMIIPGPIAINAATYIGYLHSGFWGSLTATIGVILPSFVLVVIIMHFINRYRENKVMDGALSGIKPAAVGLIAAAALKIASGVLLIPGMDTVALFSNPLNTISFLMAGIFLAAAIANIRFKVNPILLTVLAGVIGAFFA